MNRLWHIARATFLIAAGCGLFLMGYLFSNGRFNNVPSVLLLYLFMFLAVGGIGYGLIAFFMKEKE